MSTNDGSPQTATSTASPAEAASAPAATPQGVVNQLHHRYGRRQQVQNQRASERFPWATKVSLEIHEPIGTARVAEVATHDISTTGFSFLYRQFLHRGTMIRVVFDVLPDRPALVGRVQNCIHVGGMLHRVGVQFCIVNG